MVNIITKWMKKVLSKKKKKQFNYIQMHLKIYSSFHVMKSSKIFPN